MQSKRVAIVTLFDCTIRDIFLYAVLAIPISFDFVIQFCVCRYHTAEVRKPIHLLKCFTLRRDVADWFSIILRKIWLITSSFSLSSTTTSMSSCSFCSLSGVVSSAYLYIPSCWYSLLRLASHPDLFCDASSTPQAYSKTSRMTKYIPA